MPPTGYKKISGFELLMLCYIIVASTKALAEQPVLIDDDSDDSMDGYTPSPIVPLVKNEPDDIFTRLVLVFESPIPFG